VPSYRHAIPPIYFLGIYFPPLLANKCPELSIDCGGDRDSGRGWIIPFPLYIPNKNNQFE
jgi:hypothetical protein